MSDDLSDDFRAGADPIEIDLSNARVIIPQKDIISISFNELINLIRLEHHIRSKIRDFKADDMTAYQPHERPVRWQDFDLLDAQTTHQDISALLSMAKLQMRDFHVYRDIALKKQLLNPDLDKQGIQIRLRSDLQLQQPPSNFSSEVSPDASSVKQILHVFGQIACQTIMSPLGSNLGVHVSEPEMISTADIIYLFEERKALEKGIAESRQIPTEDDDMPLTERIKSLIGLPLDIEEYARIVEIDNELEILRVKGINIDEVEALYNEGEITIDNVQTQGVNLHHFSFRKF